MVWFWIAMGLIVMGFVWLARGMTIAYLEGKTRLGVSLTVLMVVLWFLLLLPFVLG